MGRIKTTLIKRTTNNLISQYGDKFKTTFDENKKIVMEVADIPTKKLRNVIAGYITRLMKQNALEEVKVVK